MKIRVLLLTAFTLTLFTAISQDLKKIEKYIEEARKTYNVPGLSVAIVKDGEVVLSKGFGVVEEGKKDKVDGETLYAIASNTKAFISSALATLVSERSIDWNDKVREYLPDFEMYDHYVTNELTIRDLLCHRAGLGTFSGDAIWYKSELPASEIVKKIKYVPQAYSFRGGYGYSNLMFITAGEIITKVSGMPWTEYLEKTFFVPLGMNRTITSTNDLDSKGNAATPHKTKPEENTPIKWTNWDNMGAAGGIISSTDDMAKWLILQLNQGIQGTDTLLTPRQQNLLWSLHNNYILSDWSRGRVPGRHFTGYGLGWGLQDYYGRMMVSHGGGYDGMYSRVVMVPDEELGVVVLTNSMSGISTPLCYYIVNQYIEEDTRDWAKEFYRAPSTDRRITALKEKRQPDTNPSLPITALAGEYYADMYGDINVIIEEGELRLGFSHSPLLNATLEHWHHDTYQIKWDEEHAWFDFGLVTFNIDEGMNVRGLSFNVPNGDIFFDEYNVIRK